MDTTEPPHQSRERANFHHLVTETFWFGIAVVTTSQFLSIYAIRLGATPVELGWLAALPAVVLLVSTWMGDWWRSRHRDSIQALLWPSLFRRFAFLLPALAPLLPREWQVEWLIVSIALPAIPQSIAAVINGVMFREAVGDHRLTALLSRRSVVADVATALSGVAFGLWLEHAAFPGNYQTIYIVAFLLVLISLWHISRIKIAPIPLIREARRPLLYPWQSASFRWVALAAAIVYVGYYVMQPIIPLRLVNELGGGEGFMALRGTLKLVAAVVVALYTNQIVEQIGNRRMMALAMLALAGEVMLLAVSNNLYIALGSAALSGIGWTMAGIGLHGFLAENTPAETTYTTAFQQTTYLATFIGPLLGGSLAGEGTGLLMVLIVGAALRFVAGAAIRAIPQHYPTVQTVSS